MSRTRFLLIALALLALPSLAQERRILLRASFANGDNLLVRTFKPKRARLVEPDFAALEAPALRRNEKKTIARPLTAALFDDTVLHLRLDSVERNAIDAIVWSGQVEGDDGSRVTIVLKDRALTAAISTREARYAIEPVAGGAHESLELDAAAFPNESEPVRIATPRQAVTANEVVVANDTGATVDVLVAYTDDVRATLGSTAAAQTQVTNAVAAANTAYANSGVTMRLRLVGTVEVNYAESGSLSTDLGALSAPNDGQMDEVHALRDQLGADDVALLVKNGGGSCGIAYIMTGSPSAGFASNAFAVIVNSCAVGNLSFPHELGHNFGLAHDRAVSPNTHPAYPYAFGYVDTGGQFRDIMAYSDACGGCARIQYFSSPNLSYLGRPLGVSYESSPSTSADNVRALNNVAVTVANWRQAVGTYTPATFTDNPLVAGTTPVKALHITELHTAIDAYRASAGLGAYAWSTVSTGDAIRATDVTEMRIALTQALPTASFTDPVPSVVLATHIQELRNYLD